ncbi:MAG: pantoate--beta-alanine ligase [Candidatus Thiodiazotropha sp. (ex Gloverina cf. vestifex)]|nr:pantoate--beta-alanine ligase [Candidatus Thiodiazotropha sp. (ex Gloverina cf. vestifex)]
MLLLNELEALRTSIAGWRQSAEKIAFVPTMGDLHAGHLELVAEARQRADRTVVSIFVNPMQFGEGEDFDAYPRTLDEDRLKLESMGADLLFTPTAEAIYPAGAGQQTRVEVPDISEILCGANRPGHFVGVATIVCKLLNMVQPDIAVFGEKDFQQLMVIRRMVTDLAIPIEIIGKATIREADGLAMSSRNGYLTAAERRQAPNLYKILQATASAINSGDKDYAGLVAVALKALKTVGFRPDYYVIRRAEDLAIPDNDEGLLVILAAAYLGTTRLIDNLIAA